MRPKPNTITPLTLPSGLTIEMVAPGHFHIPRVVADGGLKSYEAHSIAAALALTELRQGAFYDVGANIGIFSLCIASALRRRCHAYEPFPEAASVLSELQSKYHLPITVNRKCVGSAVGEAKFYLSDRSDMSNSLNPNFRNHIGEINVSITTLNIELPRDKPAVLKIDTETTEDQVLEGGLSQIELHRPAIIVELLNEKIASRVSNILTPLGYRRYPIGPGLRLNESQEISTSHDGDARNWIFSPFPLDAEFDDTLNKWRGVIFSI